MPVVPTIAETDKIAARPLPMAVTEQPTVEAEVQAVVLHMLSSSAAVGVIAYDPPKFRPLIVTEVLEHGTRLTDAIPDDVITGESNVNTERDVPTKALSTASYEPLCPLLAITKSLALPGE